MIYLFWLISDYCTWWQNPWILKYILGGRIVLYTLVVAEIGIPYWCSPLIVTLQTSQQVAKPLYDLKVQPSTLLPKQVGNMYTASIYAAFISVLHNKHSELVSASDAFRVEQSAAPCYMIELPSKCGTFSSFTEWQTDCNVLIWKRFNCNNVLTSTPRWSTSL